MTPNCSDSRAASATSAACSSALVGMQPTCRQVPPSLPFSTSADAQARAGPRAARRRSHPIPPRGRGRRTRSSAADALRHVCLHSPRLSIFIHALRPCARTNTSCSRATRPRCGTLAPWVCSTGSADAADAARGVRTGSTRVRASDDGDQQHLHEFVATRRGVEGFVEPRTAVSDVTLLLVAHDGEWTRRRVPSVEWAHDFANRTGVPSYDAARGRHPAADARLQPRARRPAGPRSGPAARGRVPATGSCRRRQRRDVLDQRGDAEAGARPTGTWP